MFWSHGSYNDLQLVLLNLYTVVLIAYHLNYHLLPIITLITTYHQLSDYLSVAFITSYTAFILLTHSVHKLFGGKIGVQRTPWTLPLSFGTWSQLGLTPSWRMISSCGGWEGNIVLNRAATACR